tara:strand:+ start:338 stop:571 length:234 start_codon:yes stop_codon:yes gene_type:complete
MNTITLKDGSKQHTLNGWIGIQPANVSITKTKWKRTDFEYHVINGYSVIKDNLGRVKCSCKGFHFRKNCRHVKELGS